MVVGDQQQHLYWNLDLKQTTFNGVLLPVLKRRRALVIVLRAESVFSLYWKIARNMLARSHALFYRVVCLHSVFFWPSIVCFLVFLSVRLRSMRVQHFEYAAYRKNTNNTFALPSNGANVFRCSCCCCCWVTHDCELCLLAVCASALSVAFAFSKKSNGIQSCYGLVGCCTNICIFTFQLIQYTANEYCICHIL